LLIKELKKIVNIFVTLAIQQHLDYLCKLFLKHHVHSLKHHVHSCIIYTSIWELVKIFSLSDGLWSNEGRTHLVVSYVNMSKAECLNGRNLQYRQLVTSDSGRHQLGVSALLLLLLLLQRYRVTGSKWSRALFLFTHLYIQISPRLFLNQLISCPRTSVSSSSPSSSSS
jgi:hypothetical protein